MELKMPFRTASRVLVPALLLLVAPIVVVAQSPRSKCGPSRLAVFDSATLLDSVPGRDEVQKVFDQRALQARRELAQVADSLKYFVDQLARSDAQFTPAQREASMHLLRARELQFEDFILTTQTAVDASRQELKAPLRARITAAVERFAASAGCDVLLDRAAMPEAVVAGSAVDLTAGILAEMRRSRRR
jgi:Skp family chaperone for outer membrane proteins